MSLRVRITYRWEALVTHGDDRRSAWLEQEPRTNSVEVAYTGGELEDYIARFNARDPGVFGRDDWPEWALSHYSSGTRHEAYNACFLQAGHPIDGIADALTLRTTPRERQVRATVEALETLRRMEAA